MTREQKPDLDRALAHLKDFQRDTVEAVFSRMYEGSKPTRRFLVADEVGLGKTLVARGVVAKAIDRLWDEVKRIDIVYLCSNSDIARQNVARLTPAGVGGVSLATRITLLPVLSEEEKEEPEKGRVNVVALTPGTSLNLKGNLGLKKERALLQYLLEVHWSLDRTGAGRFFCAPANLQAFKNRVSRFRHEKNVDQALVGKFYADLDAHCAAESARGVETTKARLGRLISEYSASSTQPRDVVLARNALIGELRHLLAKSCIKSLEPDLIILDEFQRFKELLDGVGPAGEMARDLFDYEDETSKARVILLSATPYKMYTVQDEGGAEDHYQDFLRTVRFLFADDSTSADQLSVLLKDYRRAMLRIGSDGLDTIRGIREGIEGLLTRVMVRTERLAVTPGRDGMLRQIDMPPLGITAGDAANYQRVQALARLVDQADTMEFWKASPWLLNFMDTYKLKEELDELIDGDQRNDFMKVMRRAEPSFLPADDVGQFKSVDVPHPKLRWLLEHALGSEQWRLLWLPPSLPYHQLGSPFAEHAGATKSLLFSAWRMVPRVVAAVVSYEAERRAYHAFESDKVDGQVITRLGDALSIRRREGKVAGLTTLAIIYPSPALARLCDPLSMSGEVSKQLGRLPTVAELLAEAERRIERALTPLIPSRPARNVPDESWYWAAPVMLDIKASKKAAEWLDTDLEVVWGHDGATSAEDSPEFEEDSEGHSASSGSGDDADSGALGEFIERLRSVVKGEVPAGVPPRDLVRVLALMAIAGPATCALRSLSRVSGDSSVSSRGARDAAARIGSGFQTLFNQPDSTAVVRLVARESESSGDYWKECLQYAAAGCLQSVLDEYAHLLLSEAGVFGHSSEEVLEAVAENMVDSLGIRRATIGYHKITVANRVRSTPAKVRSRFAVRFGEERADDSGEKLRADLVRKAFNSPFAPFVLATTSVGQEGLDFHYYCHRVVHWNLPPNPVDLEQREGRVHRFKGHAVRRNVAQVHACAVGPDADVDPWQTMFEAARSSRAATDSDLIPFWVFAAPGGATIERFVPAYALSRDVERFRALRESLALYRMVFGQPRQDELLTYLVRVLPPDEIARVSSELAINLAPAPA